MNAFALLPAPTLTQDPKSKITQNERLSSLLTPFVNFKLFHH